MKPDIVQSKKEIENKQQISRAKDDFDNVLKVGTFQLQTRSFWLGLVAMLTIFMFSLIWLIMYYYSGIVKNLAEENTKLVQIISEITRSKQSFK